VQEIKPLKANILEFPLSKINIDITQRNYKQFITIQNNGETAYPENV